MKGVDIAFDSYVNEFVLGKKRVMVKPSAQQYLDGEPVFDPDDLAYYVLPEDIEDGAIIQPIDMNLRTAEHSEGIRTQLIYFPVSAALAETIIGSTGAVLLRPPKSSAKIPLCSAPSKSMRSSWRAPSRNCAASSSTWATRPWAPG